MEWIALMRPTLVIENQIKTDLVLTSDYHKLSNCNIYIITVPTPITQFKTPDLSYLISASEAIGGILRKGDIVIYESTVYPGCTEEECVPVLEKHSRLKFNKDFIVVILQSINPGDKITLTKIKKVIRINSSYC